METIDLVKDKSSFLGHSLSGAYIAYYLTLALLLAASFFPEYRVWGVNFWAYHPAYVPAGLFVFGVLIPLVALRLPGRCVDESVDISYRTALLVSVVFILLYVLMFYLLRTRTHFLGDGYLLLGSLSSENPLIKPSNYGGGIIPLLLAELLGDRTEAGVLLSYRIVAVSAGVGFLVAVALSVRALFQRNLERLLFLLGLSSAGYMLLFFGYVENYAFFVLAVTVFGLVGLLIVTGRAARWWVLPLLALAVFFHVFGVVLISGAVYLLTFNTRFARWLSNLPAVLRWGLAVVAAVLCAAAFYHFYTTSYFFRFAFIPLVENRFTAEGYTLFAGKHLLDYVNLLLLLFPGLPVVLFLLLRLPCRELLRRPEYRFLLTMLVSCAGAVFVFDPKLGMPRDWDLFSFAGVPMVLAGLLLVLQTGATIRWRVTVIGLMVTLGFFSIGPRVMTLASSDLSVDYVRNCFGLDRAKNRPLRSVLVGYLNSEGRTIEAQEEMTTLNADFPEIALSEKCFHLFTGEKYAEAIQCYREVLRLNPLFHDSYGLLGLCFLRMNQNENAQYYLETADGLNPYNAEIINNLGVAYLRNGLFDKGEEALVRSLKVDSTLLNSIVSLINLYIHRNDVNRSYYYFQRLQGLKEIPFSIPKTIGDTYLKKGFVDQAAVAYDLALQRGLDSAYVRNLAEKHATLSKIL